MPRVSITRWINPALYYQVGGNNYPSKLCVIKIAMSVIEFFSIPIVSPQTGYQQISLLFL